ncbi:MAG: DUF1549 domain-containing protein [Planctomycetaceae bacterium]
MPRAAALAAALLGVFSGSFSASAADRLHVRIDRLIEARAAGPVAAPATDAEFLRRTFLDLTGRIPSAAEARAFLADTSSKKRGKLIDRLLAGPEYSRRMAELFHVVLMERRGDNAEWAAFLRSSFEQNKPWDRIAREILSPDADDKATRGAAFFYSRRLEKYGQNPTDFPGLTRDVGRLFLGMDLQCAQCHDHVHIEDYKQRMYQGLFAFLGNVFIRRETKFPAVGVKPLRKKLDFMSVFLKEPNSTGPRVPGDTEISIPTFKKGEEFTRPPDRKTRFPGEPKFNTLKQLGERLPRAENKPFVRNIVNRLWFAMMGRGLVHPLDLHHSKNPPSHPQLLELLSREFVAHKFDIKWLLRELALTKTYQRSGMLPRGVKRVPEASYRVCNERALSAEQLLRSMLVATGSTAKLQQAARFDELRPDFVAAFGNTPRDPEITFNPSVKSALFMMNSPKVLDLLVCKPGNLIDRLAKTQSTAALAEELYLTVLTRRPTADEKQTVAEHLKQKGADRAQAVAQLAWALLSSTEFCVNH